MGLGFGAPLLLLWWGCGGACGCARRGCIWGVGARAGIARRAHQPKQTKGPRQPKGPRRPWGRTARSTAATRAVSTAGAVDAAGAAWGPCAERAEREAAERGAARGTRRACWVLLSVLRRREATFDAAGRRARRAFPLRHRRRRRLRPSRRRLRPSRARLARWHQRGSPLRTCVRRGERGARGAKGSE